MWPDRVSNPGTLTYESGALPIALRGPALTSKGPKTRQEMDICEIMRNVKAQKSGNKWTSEISRNVSSKLYHTDSLIFPFLEIFLQKLTDFFLIGSSFNSFNYQKADDKIFICKFSKNVKSKVYHIENSNCIQFWPF